MSSDPNLPYALTRAYELGLTETTNKVQVWLPNQDRPQERMLLAPSYTREDNMLILYLGLEKREGAYVAMTHKSTIQDAYTQIEKEVEVAYYNTRLKNPKPGQPKYKNPTGVPAQPYLSPMLIDAWHERRPIETLVLVEGALKALKGCLCGLMVIGINGIWGMRETKSKELHPVVQEVLQACNVKHLVYLHDNDCRQITAKYATDLLTRPLNFAQSVIHFSKAAKNYKAANPKLKDFSWYYAHLAEDGPKGLDDLLISLGDQASEAVAELSAPQKNAETKPRYFVIQDLWNELKSIASIKTYFYVDCVDRFYEFHSAQLDEDDFIYGGDWYRYNEETEKVECTLSGAASEYVLVGNKYLKEIYVNNSKGLPELVRDHRHINIILDDFKRRGIKNAAELMLQIPKYDNYTNEPDFINYRKEHVVKDRYRMLNVAYPLEHEVIEGEWPTTHTFLAHIFHNGGDSKLEVGLDMIQMYYTMPKQKQRILSLVSKENETGKTTFLLWLREIFGQNMSIVGSADFKSQFNGYVTKCIVGVDESKIDDPAAIEAIKSLVTSPYSNLNEKNTAARQIVNHVKLIMTTNHIFDFAHIGTEENKWFVLEVGKIDRRDNTLLDRLKEEIPAFLHYLQNRKLVHYTRESRFAIPDEAVQTKALKRVQDNSRPQLVVMIEDYVRGFFNDYPEKVRLKIDAKRLYEALFPERSTRYSSYDIEKTLKNEFNLKPSIKSEYFTVPVQNVVAQESHDEETGELTEAQVAVKWQHHTGKVYEFLRVIWMPEANA